MGSSGGSSGGSVTYGTTAGTATEGNDARLLNLIGDLLDTGEETVSRDATNNALAIGGSNLYLTYFTARKSETITQLRGYTSAAAGATPTLCRLGLYTIDASGNGTLVAATANDTTIWSAATSVFTRALLASYATAAGQRYAIGTVCVTAASLPSLLCLQMLGNPEPLMSPITCGRLASQTDLPASFLGSALASSNFRLYNVLLP